MEDNSNTELIRNYGIEDSTLLIQGLLLLLWLGLVIWAILKVLKKTQGTESAIWAVFIALVPFTGIPVSLVHFRNK